MVMFARICRTAVVLAALSAAALPARDLPSGGPQAAGALKALAVAPIRFERAPDAAGFAAQGVNYHLQVAPQGASLRFADQTGAARNVRFTLLGASPDAAVEGRDRMPVKTNYFRGADRSKWRTDVPVYRRVRAAGVYPGIDLLYYGNGQHLEYDFVVQPHADPGAIRFRFTGVDSVRVDKEKNLVLSTGGVSILQRKPIVYQRAGDGSRVLVKGEYQGELAW